MKRTDIIVIICTIALLAPFFIFPGVYSFYKTFNAEHGIIPKTVKKIVSNALTDMTEADFVKDDKLGKKEISDIKNIDKKLKEYTKKMKDAAANLEFEEAVIYRDKIKELEQLAMKNL